MNGRTTVSFNARPGSSTGTDFKPNSNTNSKPTNVNKPNTNPSGYSNANSSGYANTNASGYTNAGGYYANADMNDELDQNNKNTNKEIMEGCKLRLLKWISEASGERVTTWERVSRGDVICFILNRMRPGVLDLPTITDGVDKFARVGNWRIASQAMRKLKMNWNYDQVKLVMADQPELEKLVLAIRRWETRFMDEPLEPPSPDEWNENDIPEWFTQQTAKEIEEKKLAMGESRTKHQSKKAEELDIRKMSRAQRKPLSDQIRGKF